MKPSCQSQSKGICPQYSVWGFRVKSFGGIGAPVEQGHCTHYYNQSNIWLDKNKTPCCVCKKYAPTDWSYKVFSFMMLVSLLGFMVVQVYLGSQGR